MGHSAPAGRNGIHRREKSLVKASQDTGLETTPLLGISLINVVLLFKIDMPIPKMLIAVYVTGFMLIRLATYAHST